jgi:endonuclease YncB( thermonuclease family)
MPLRLNNHWALNLEITCDLLRRWRSQSLIDKSNGTIHVLPIEEDRYGRTVAELWIPIKPDYEGEIHLNTAMVEAGMAYHYQQYSGNCESAENLGWAEKIAKDDKLGVWNGSHQEPWEFRQKAKK